MRGKSHLSLGQYLIKHYMQDISRIHASAFLLGCIEPDRNPITYLKGSLRHQWLRGHNYYNARRYMRKLSYRLEKKENFTLYNYYTLGKLMHYTADAFTYAHNAHFPDNLADHREYEAILQNHFLEFIQQEPKTDLKLAYSIMQIIYNYHREYEQLDADVRNDAKFALNACCCILTLLFVKPMI